MKSSLLPLASCLLMAFNINVTAASNDSSDQPPQQVYNLGKVNSDEMNNRYPGFEDSYNQAYIGLPKGFADLEEPFYGTLEEAKSTFDDLADGDTTYPTVLYMQGSGSFSKGPTFREWITGDLGWVFFAPSTHTSHKRPKYSSPVAKEVYEEIHHYRQAEIDQFVKHLDDLPFIDKERMFLMGNSEGALAAARYGGKEFVGRIVLSWSCEPGYFTDLPKVGSSYKTDPFLNIVGRDDVYFGTDSPYNNQYDNDGHCGDALLRYENAKVVLLPNTGHNVMANPFTKAEVLDFLNMFKDHKIDIAKEK